jgi:hypothetical protein
MPTRTHQLMGLMVFLAATLVLAAPLGSQADPGARLRGLAISSFNGQPVRGVLVAVPAARKFVVTDSSGAFLLTGLPGGDQKVRVSYEGRDTEEYEFTLRGGRTTKIAVLLDLDAPDLDPVVVEVQHPDQWRDLGGFYARRDWYRGYARFYTQEEIERSHSPRISALLARERIVTRCVELCRPTRFSRGQLCAVPISVNGMPLREQDYDRIAVRDVRAVEVYRNVTPYGLNIGMRLAPFSAVWNPSTDVWACGSVFIWTR